MVGRPAVGTARRHTTSAPRNWLDHHRCLRRDAPSTLKLPHGYPNRVSAISIQTKYKRSKLLINLCLASGLPGALNVVIGLPRVRACALSNIWSNHPGSLGLPKEAPIACEGC